MYRAIQWLGYDDDVHRRSPFLPLGVNLRCLTWRCKDCPRGPQVETSSKSRLADATGRSRRSDTRCRCPESERRAEPSSLGPSARRRHGAPGALEPRPTHSVEQLLGRGGAVHLGHHQSRPRHPPSRDQTRNERGRRAEPDSPSRRCSTPEGWRITSSRTHLALEARRPRRRRHLEESASGTRQNWRSAVA